MSTEGMIYGIRFAAISAWVKAGDELLDLAAGRVTLTEIAAIRRCTLSAPLPKLDLTFCLRYRLDCPN